MSQSTTEVQVASVEVAPVAEKKLKVQRKSKKMMTEQNPVIPKKIDLDFQSSAEGSVSQQASQMSQPVVRKITISKSKKAVPKKEEVPVAVVQEVAELLAEMVENAYQEELKQKKKAVALMKAKATREANKLKKKQEEEERLAREAEEDAERTETEDEDEEGEEKEEGEYERSTKKRPIQKSKEGRVLEGRIEAVEGEVKKELKVLKMKLGELVKEEDDVEKVREKREKLELKKREATSKLHHTIAEKFNTSVVVARRSEAGKGEKKNFASKPVQLKDKTTEKLFWANCERILPHFVKDFTTFAQAKKEYATIYTNCFSEEGDEGFSVEKRREAYNKFYEIFQRCAEALVSDACDVIKAEHGPCLFYDNMYMKLVLATHLSVQGIYVVKRVENPCEVPLVLRNSRDELIEIGNANEVMSVPDLVHHSRGKVLSLGEGILRKLCGAVAKKAKVVAFAPADDEE